eukprot:4748333-Alexandrium_andersonii.AAC.1
MWAERCVLEVGRASERRTQAPRTHSRLQCPHKSERGVLEIRISRTRAAGEAALCAAAVKQRCALQ